MVNASLNWASLITTGLLTVVAGGAVAYAAIQRKPA